MTTPTPTMHQLTTCRAQCVCPTRQTGWATGKCDTCGGVVVYTVWCASYPGKAGTPKDPDDVKRAIAAVREQRHRFSGD